MRTRAARERGMTLVELVLAAGLSAIVMTAVIRLLDVTLDMWAKGESKRNVVEQATATAELMATDLRALHPGNQGDLWVDWFPFDVDQDGVIDRFWPRVRMVRQASRADLARLASARMDPALMAEAKALGVPIEDLLPPVPDGEEPEPPATSGLMAVSYAIVPAGKGPDDRAEGVLLRGEEIFQPGVLPAFFEQNYFSAGGQPRDGSMREVTGGVLWCGLQFATQTSIVRDGWNLGPDLSDTCASWDAWNFKRPDPEQHFWNEPGAGMPVEELDALLPRRVHIELEFETSRDRRKRTRLLQSIDKATSQILVEEGSNLPQTVGSYLLIGGEWMQLTRVRDDRASVRRACRGTEAVMHGVGAMVHWGELLQIEVPIPTYRDDWNLGGRR